MSDEYSLLTKWQRGDISTGEYERRAERLVNPGRRKVEDEGNVCRICGNGPAEAAHLWPRSLGGGGFDEPDLIVPLDRSCHTRFDARELDIAGHLTRSEEVALVRAAGLERAYRRAVPSSCKVRP